MICPKSALLLFFVVPCRTCKAQRRNVSLFQEKTSTRRRLAEGSRRCFNRSSVGDISVPRREPNQHDNAMTVLCFCERCPNNTNRCTHNRRPDALGQLLTRRPSCVDIREQVGWSFREWAAVLTTFMSYGSVAGERQAHILNELSRKTVGRVDSGEPDASPLSILTCRTSPTGSLGRPSWIASYFLSRERRGATTLVHEPLERRGNGFVLRCSAKNLTDAYARAENRIAGHVQRPGRSIGLKGGTISTVRRRLLWSCR
jgi:hypothetical protein